MTTLCSRCFIPAVVIFPEKGHILAVKRRRMTMRRVNERRVPSVRMMRCRGGMRWLGCALIAWGLVLLFLCIPCWAWAALSGAALVAAGWALLMAGGR